MHTLKPSHCEKKYDKVTYERHSLGQSTDFSVDTAFYRAPNLDNPLTI